MSCKKSIVFGETKNVSLRRIIKYCHTELLVYVSPHHHDIALTIYCYKCCSNRSEFIRIQI